MPIDHALVLEQWPWSAWLCFRCEAYSKMGSRSTEGLRGCWEEPSTGDCALEADDVVDVTESRRSASGLADGDMVAGAAAASAASAATAAGASGALD